MNGIITGNFGGYIMKCKVVKKDSSDINKQILDILNRYDNKPVDFEFVKEVLMILRKRYHCEDTLKKMKLIYV